MDADDHDYVFCQSSYYDMCVDLSSKGQGRHVHMLILMPSFRKEPQPGLKQKLQETAGQKDTISELIPNDMRALCGSLGSGCFRFRSEQDLPGFTGFSASSCMEEAELRLATAHQRKPEHVRSNPP